MLHHQLTPVEGILQDPKTLRRWLAWKLTVRPNGTVEKLPMSVSGGGYAACDSPSTWGSYDEARAFVTAHSDHCLGFVLGKEVGLCVIDIDKARKTQDEPWPYWAEREVDELDSFTETSVSGLGLHVWVWGQVPSNLNKQKAHLEIHGHDKMFCVSPAFAEQWEQIKTRDLTDLHARIASSRCGPNYHPKVVVYSHNETKFRDIMEGNFQKWFNSASEAVASALCTLARKHTADADKMREEFEASAMRAIWGAKWDRLADKEIERAITWYKEKKAKDGFADQILQFKHARATPQKAREYVLQPKNKFDGWFPRGSVSIVGGPSGAGKTTVMLDLLHEQQEGREYLGHKGSGFCSLVLFADREEEDNQETLERLGLTESAIVMECLPLVWDFAAVTAILDAIERSKLMPQVVLVEGADMLPSEPNALPVVSQLLKYLQLIAQQYRIAFVLSAGAPKSSPDKQHTLMRDRIFGSQIWGRMASTIATMSIPGDGTGDKRQLDIQHRNAPSESFPLTFEEGKLVYSAKPTELDALEIWASQYPSENGRFTMADALGGMKVAGSPLSPNLIKKRVLDLVKEQKLEQLITWQGVGDQKIMKLRFRWKHTQTSDMLAPSDPPTGGQAGTSENAQAAS